MTLPADEIREQIIANTLAHMDENGIAGVKARTIAREAGVSVGTVYNMFGSLDGLIQEANARILESFASQALKKITPLDERRKKRLASKQIDQRQALEERLYSFAEVYMDFVEKNEGRWAAMLAYNQQRSVDIESEDYDRLQGELFAFLGKSLDSTRLANDEQKREQTTRMLWSSVHGIVVLNYIGQVNETSRTDTWDLIKIFVSTFVRGIMQDNTA